MLLQSNFHSNIVKIENPKFNSTMIDEQTQSLHVFPSYLSKNTSTDMGKITKSKVVEKNVQLILSPTKEVISNGKFSDHIRDAYPNMVKFSFLSIK